MTAITNILVIHRSTGEEVTADYVVTNRRQATAYRKRKEAEQYEITDVGKRWVASYHDPIRSIIKNLSLFEAGAIVKLLHFCVLWKNNADSKNHFDFNSHTLVKTIIRRSVRYGTGLCFKR
ncbi:hypothetical protein ACSVDA_02385 [Cytobacillus sp. Hm23]